MNRVDLLQQLHYRIIIECNNCDDPITLAGFDAAEQSESLLCRHLSNLCVQSDGSFLCTQKLVGQLLQTWQQSFSMNTIETLKIGSTIQKQLVSSVCLYKMFEGDKEQLINRVKF